MIIDCAHYREGRRQHEGPISLDEAAARCRQGGFVWLGLFEPLPEELTEVRRTFGLHELAVEDAQTFHLRPKFERFEQDVQFVILPLRASTTPERKWTSGRSASFSDRGS